MSLQISNNEVKVKEDGVYFLMAVSQMGAQEYVGVNHAVGATKQ